MKQLKFAEQKKTRKNFIQNTPISSMRGSRKFCQRGTTLTTFFFIFFSLMRGGGIKIPLLVGQHRLTSETPFKLRSAGVPMMALH